MVSSTIVYVDSSKPRLENFQTWRGDIRSAPRDVLERATCVLSPLQGERNGLVNHLPEGFEVGVIPSRNGRYAIADRDPIVPESKLVILPEPFPGSSANTHPSPVSQALYYATRRTDNRTLLIQELQFHPGNGSFAYTSCHHHEYQRELWVVLAGSVSIIHRPADESDDWCVSHISSRSGETHMVIDPGVIHQLRTTTYGLVYLLMDNCPTGNFHADHHYNAPPPAHLL